jgi:hypothetical protein
MKMNKFKYLFTALICIIAFNSCDEDKLELVNPNQLSPETFLQTPAQVQSAVNAIYANMQTRGLYARHMFFMMDNMGADNIETGHLEADKVQYLKFTFDASHGSIFAYWNSCYRGINKANYVIGNAETIDLIDESAMSAADKDRVQGEAKFMRAFYYFLLVTRFGDIPLISEIPATGDGVPKSPASEIYGLIESDLTDAAALLPAKGDIDNGRATKGAAYALLGKAHLYQEDWPAAITALENVTGYSLEDNYYNNFMEETEHGPESIFEVEFDPNLGYSAVWNSTVDGLGSVEATFRAQEYGFLNWNNVEPTPDLRAEFEAGDTRFGDSFYVAGDKFNNGESTVGAPGFEFLVSTQTAGWKKYQNYYKQATELNNVSGINFKVIRYSDVLLMLAEAENNISAGSTAAIGYINQVRARAGLGATTAVTGPQIFDAIVHERRVEFAGEQSRFPDLVRWGLAGSVLSAEGFVTGKHEVFPIPRQEIEANSALTTDDQNPGYN